MLLSLIVLQGCTPPTSDGTPPLPPTDKATDTLPIPPAPPTGATGTTGSTGVTGDTAPPLDCSVRPALPLSYTTLTGFGTAEDFDIDVNGNQGSIRGGDLVLEDGYGNATPTAIDVAGAPAGTRVLATGDWIVADSATGSLKLVDIKTGGNVRIGSGFTYPNGLEVDALNRAYVADQSQGVVRMVDVYSDPLLQYPVASGLNQPNGVVLSPDEQTLYVGSFGGGVVYAIDRITDTTWDTPRVIYDVGGYGGYDGINVDLCGTVYITEYIVGDIIRIDPTGKLAAERAANLPSYWIPNMRWGNDVGVFQSDVLYVSDRVQGRLFGLQIGIPGKPHVGLP